MSARKCVLVVVTALLMVFATLPIVHARTLDGAITGLVLLPNGKPAGGVKVQVFQGMWSGMNSKEWVPLGAPVTTGRNGSYKVAVPPGTYRIWFVPLDLEQYCMEAYPDAPQPYAGDDVIVKAGKATGRVSVRLDGSPGALDGTVYDASTGEPLEGIKLRLGFQAPAIVNTEFGYAWSDSTGHYRFPGLKSWMWGAWAIDEDGIEPYYLDLMLFDWEWTPQPGTRALDFDLEPEGFVSVEGILTNANTSLGIPGATISAQLLEDGDFFDYTETPTGPDGEFSFVNLPAGQWQFRAWADGYNDRYYGGEDEYGKEVYVQRGQPTTLGEWTLQPLYP